MVLGGTVMDDATNEWLTLAQKAPPNGNQLTSPVVGWYNTRTKHKYTQRARKTRSGMPRDAVVAFEDVVRVHGYGGEANPIGEL
nr:lysine-specific demethylase REF6 [Tanacetum cinerariifolium]